MPVKQKTTEEYHTMAMLLGYEYNRGYHVFDAIPYSAAVDWRDPDTLKPVLHGELSKRYNYYQEKELAPVTMEGNNDPTENT